MIELAPAFYTIFCGGPLNGEKRATLPETPWPLPKQIPHRLGGYYERIYENWIGSYEDPRGHEASAVYTWRSDGSDWPWNERVDEPPRYPILHWATGALILAAFGIGLFLGFWLGLSVAGLG